MLRQLATGLIAAAMVVAVGQAQSADKDIVDTAVAAGSFTTLAKALQAADLVDTLKGKGPFTVFAPTDAAFARLPPATLEDLLKPTNKAKLRRILTYHVVPGRVTAADVGEADVGQRGERRHDHHQGQWRKRHGGRGSGGEDGYRRLQRRDSRHRFRDSAEIAGRLTARAGLLSSCARLVARCIGTFAFFADAANLQRITPLRRLSEDTRRRSP